jgi:hypothetical protein
MGGSERPSDPPAGGAPLDEVPLGVSAADLVRWSEALSGIARTGLGFTESLYEQERFEEVLKVAADIRTAAGSEHQAEVLFEEWMKAVGSGVAGYVTPRSPSVRSSATRPARSCSSSGPTPGVWLYPTGGPTSATRPSRWP